MYLGDRHINFDSYYDDPNDDYDEPETEEEIAQAIAAAEAERAEWDAAETAWKEADQKCKCGRWISFSDFYHDGICFACISEAMELFFSQENTNDGEST